MKGILILTLLLVSSLCWDFDAYAARFQKIYQTPEQRESRKALYYTRCSQYDTINSQNLQYQVGQNQFTDRYDSQIQQMAGLTTLNIRPVTNPQIPKLRATTSLPKSVDWRNQNKVTSVKSQGTCGSCWAFSTTAAYQSWTMIGGLTTPPDLSQEYVLECTTASSTGGYVSSCAGGYVDDSMPFVLSTGIPKQSVYPYLGTNFGSGSATTPTTSGICTPAAADVVKQTTLSGVFKGSYQNLTNTQMKDLISFAPIVVLMYANSAFMSYTTGTFTGCPTFASSVGSINHAVVIVGYDTNGNYIIKNSWGTTWGQNGYAVVSKDADCGFSYQPKEWRGTNTQLKYQYHLISIIMAAIIIMGIL